MNWTDIFLQRKRWHNVTTFPIVNQVWIIRNASRREIWLPNYFEWLYCILMEPATRRRCWIASLLPKYHKNLITKNVEIIAMADLWPKLYRGCPGETNPQVGGTDMHFTWNFDEHRTILIIKVALEAEVNGWNSEIRQKVKHCAFHSISIVYIH